MKARHVSSNIFLVYRPEPGTKPSWTRRYDPLKNEMCWRVYGHGYDGKLFVCDAYVHTHKTEQYAANEIRSIRRNLKRYLFYYSNMKILGSSPVKFIPMTFFKPEHFAQMEKNHFQTPNCLNERGGLSSEEMIAVLSCKSFKDRPKVNNPDRYLDAMINRIKLDNETNTMCQCTVCKGKAIP